MNVFLTGASSGLGHALAREFASRGARLGLVARRRELLDELNAQLGGRHEVYPLDVADRAALVAAARAFERATGGADVVVANAGISAGMLTEFEADLDVLREILEVNVLAMAATFHPFIAPMRARGRGRLVGIASVAGIRGLPGSAGYCASKAAALSYCESLRVELRRTGVEVLTIAPGFVRTPMTARNPYPMPFLIDAERFARSAADAIERGASYTVIPWPMSVVAKLLRLLPNAVFDRVLGRRAYKPRRSDAGGGPAS
ncbi:MAG TPA: SDR family oxidoreductase [Burkholderiaceae bacterium]|nr:SDR family oxidoreductase [Burkholderiaceae bacterium]